MLTSSDATNLITDLQGHWIAALSNHQYEWLERHLAEDFMFTAHPFPALKLHKREFIEADKKIESAEVKFISVRAEPAGEIIISRTVADVKEEFNADLGPGMPTASEITRMVSGQRLAYCSGWRHNGQIWQCFDHHLVSIIRHE
jgi:hypothetical protein